MEMRTVLGCKKVGAVGHCFGAKYVVRHLQPDMKIDVRLNAHPSFITEDRLRAIKGPLVIAAAETDAIFPAEKRQHTSEAILKETGLPYQITLLVFFAVRGDPNKRVDVCTKEAAFIQCLRWFQEHLKD
ncbi:hypothetical protein BBP40_008837 [Aspergillus hancockii]|nr:hypothetical protein BBP40_008837 [Aspergillus hancockii]